MFYKTGVDIANTKSMWEFLHNHYTYYTQNSWNRQKTIANNVKLYNLNLDGDWTIAMNYMFDENDSGCLQEEIDNEIREFEERNQCYSVYFNGRSNGHLVLYDVALRGTVLPDCVADYDCYEDFKEDCRDIGHLVSDYNRELREAVEITREFDKLCDRLRDIVNEFSTRSFDTDKLEYALNRFEDEYLCDICALGLASPEMDGDKIKLNDIKDFRAFMHCFFECFGDDKRRVTSNDTHVWLKEF